MTDGMIAVCADVITSVTGPTYSTTMRAKWEGRQQYCVVTDKYGNTLTTDIVTFHVG